jgi:S1-C subfamily serine protease
MSTFDYPSYDRPRPRPPQSPSWLPLLVLLLLAVVAIPVGVAWWLWPRGAGGQSEDVVPRTVTPRGDLAQEEKTTIEIYRKASPSVVNVTSLNRPRSGQEKALGTGSGVIWDKQGRVVTNYHVIEGANGARVTLQDHSVYNASLVGAYPDKDLAVLVINAPADKLVPIDVGTSEDLQVGQRVFAIGNPFGLDHTLTTGIVSALNREIESVTQKPIRGVIQTDAAINPGNSGGALLDSAGRLIGINTAIYSPSGASAGIGFAIPVDEVNRVAPQLIAQKTGQTTKKIATLGINPAADQTARRFHLPGVLVLTATPGGPAEKAGVRATHRDPDTDEWVLGDVIVGLGDAKVRTRKELNDAVDAHQVGDKVTLHVIRENKPQDVAVTLEAAPE